jgi:hypothetical protein
MDNGILLDSEIFVWTTETGARARKLIFNDENPSTAGVEHNKAAAATATTIEGKRFKAIDRILRFVTDKPTR